MLPHGQNIIEKNAYGVPVGRKGAASTAVRAKFAKTDFRESSGRKVLPHGQNIIEKTAYGVPIGRKGAAKKRSVHKVREHFEQDLTNRKVAISGFYPIHAGNIARKDV